MRLVDISDCGRELFYKQMGGKDSFITVESAFNMLMALPTVDVDTRIVDDLADTGMMEKHELNLKEGHAVAFDFDGVIHKYSKGWQDGSIYDEPNMEVLELILLLQSTNIPCVIISTREPQQIKDWWDKQSFTIQAKVLDFNTTFYNDCSCVGITNRKIPAQVYVDDRAYKYTGQTLQQFLIDFATEVD